MARLQPKPRYKPTRPPVTFITTRKGARKHVERLIREAKPTALDTEFDEERPEGDQIVIFSISTGRGDRTVIDGSLLKYYKDWIENPATKLVYQNFKEDAIKLQAAGIDPVPSFHCDIMITDWLCDENDPKHGLKHQARKWLHWFRKEYATLFSYVPAGKKKPVVLNPTQIMTGKNYAGDPVPDEVYDLRSLEALIKLFIEYASDDAESTIALYWHHRKVLQSIGYWETYLEIDHAFTLTLMDCQRRGVVIDLPTMKRIQREVLITKMKYVHAFRAACGKPDINLNSGPQLHKLFFEELEWPTRKDLVTAGGKPQINRAARHWWIDEHDFLLAKLLEGYMGVKTLDGTFLTGIIEGVSEDGRLRSDLNQIGANTGRISSRKIDAVVEETVTDRKGNERTVERRVKIGANLQNIPARKEKDPYGIRGAFIAPRCARTKVLALVKRWPDDVRQAIEKRLEKDEPFSDILRADLRRIVKRSGYRDLLPTLRREYHGDITADGTEALEDYDLIVADYTGFELYMAIHWAGMFTPESEMLKAAQRGDNIHALTALRMGLVPKVQLKTVKEMIAKARAATDAHEKERIWNDIKKVIGDNYSVAKQCNFNLLYGGRAKMLCRILGLHLILNKGEPADKLSRKNLKLAEKYIKAWNKAWPEMRVYQKRIVDYGRKHGYVKMISGRRCNVKEGLASHDDYERMHWERKCMNTPCQGSAADVVKVAMNLANRSKKLRKLGCRLLYPVHDELVFECPKRTAKEALPLCVKIMQKPFSDKFRFTLVVEGKHASNWRAAK